MVKFLYFFVYRSDNKDKKDSFLLSLRKLPILPTSASRHAGFPFYPHDVTTRDGNKTKHAKSFPCMCFTPQALQIRSWHPPIPSRHPLVVHRLVLERDAARVVLRRRRGGHAAAADKLGTRAGAGALAQAVGALAVALGGGRWLRAVERLGRRGGAVGGHLEAVAVHGAGEAAAQAGAVAVVGGRARLDGEARLGPAAAAVAAMAARAGVGAGRAAAAGRGLFEERPVALLHERLAVALVGADGAGSVAAADGGRVAQRRHAFQLAKDGVLVGKEIADKSDGMLLLHGEGGLGARAEDTAGESCGQ